jgi:membrane-associated phospholipid phosphatase
LLTIDRPARLRRTLRQPIATGAVLFGVMLGLRGWLQWVGPLPGDRYALAHYSAYRPGLPSSVIDAYVAVAEPWVVVAIVLVGMSALWRHVGLREAIGLALASLVIVWNAILKALFGASPLWAHAHGGVNYPSGHTSYAMGVFGYLAWIGWRRRQYELLAVCVLVIVGMGPERVLSATHLPSDVIGGYLLGLSWLCVVLPWVARGPVIAAGRWSRRRD